MSDTSGDPIPYQVSYSELVRNELKKLLARAEERGLGSLLRAAARELDRRLHIFPQFGDPLCDLSQESAQLWVGTVPPLVVHYAVYEERRLVIVGTPFETLPHSGF